LPSVELLLRYGDLVLLKMAVIRHFGFLEAQNFKMIRMVKSVILHHHTKLHGDQSSRYRDIAICRFSRWWPSSMLDF